MSTTSQNNQVYDKGTPLFYPVLTDGTYDINQNDLVYFDTSAKVIKPLDSDAHAAYLAGVALQQSKLNVYGSSSYPQGGIQVATKGIFKFLMTSGDTYYHGDAVYFSTDAQHVTNTAGGMTHILGYVWLRPGQSSLAYAAGSYVEVLIVPAFPVAGGL